MVSICDFVFRKVCHGLEHDLVFGGFAHDVLGEAFDADVEEKLQ